MKTYKVDIYWIINFLNYVLIFSLKISHYFCCDKIQNDMNTVQSILPQYDDPLKEEVSFSLDILM